MPINFLQKRPSLAIDNISAQLFSSQPSSRQGSEDWVQQTDGLRIGTPVVSSSPSPVVNESDDVVRALLFPT